MLTVFIWFYFSVVSWRLKNQICENIAVKICASFALIFYTSDSGKCFACYIYVFLHVLHMRSRALVNKKFASKLQCRHSTLMGTINFCTTSKFCIIYKDMRGKENLRFYLLVKRSTRQVYYNFITKYTDIFC